MQIASPVSVVGDLALAVLAITVVYSIPSIKIVLHELVTLPRSWRKR